jgi:hypothetical protein
MQSTKELVRVEMQKFHRELPGTVDSASAFEKANTLADNVFKGLENDYQQTKAFEQLLGYIKLVQVKLGEMKCNQVIAGKYQLMSGAAYGKGHTRVNLNLQFLQCPLDFTCCQYAEERDEQHGQESA